MGWGRWLLLGDLGQQLDLQQHRTELERARVETFHRSRVVSRRVEAVEAECDELKLYLAAFVRILVDKKIATQDEVIDLVEAIDREDGDADRKTAAGLPRRRAARPPEPAAPPSKPTKPVKLRYRPRPRPD